MAVKYMIMMFGSAEEMMQVQSKDWVAEMIAFMTTLNDDLTASGELVAARGLVDGSQAKTVRVRDGVPAVTDGPFVEAKEHLAGYCLFECETPERAIEIAVRWPDARHWAVELRPLMTASGEEM